MSYFLKQLSQKILIGGQPKNLCSRGTVHHKCHEASYDGYLFIGISPICSWHIERSRAWSGALLLDPHMCPRLSDLEKNAASLSQWLSTWQHCRFTGDSWETHMPGSQPPRSIHITSLLHRKFSINLPDNFISRQLNNYWPESRASMCKVLY